MIKNKKNIPFCAIIILAFIDQFVKWIVVKALKDGRVIPIWKEVFELRYLENHGAAFGLFQNQRILFLIIGCVVFFYLYRVLKHLSVDAKFNKFLACIVLIGAGAIGNTLDRIRFGYVIDFFYFKIIDFPIFNIADIYITIGSILIVILLAFYYNDDDLKEISESFGGKK